MIKLLIVDDEPLIQIGIKSILNWTEYNIEVCGTALNGTQALQLIEKHSPEIVITDIKMPVMDGLELAKICKERYGTLPLFIILTSHEEFPLLKEAIKYDIVDYLVKLELTKESLSASIQKALGILKKNAPSSSNDSLSSMHSFYEKFFIFLLHNLFKDEEQFLKEARTLNLDFSFDAYVATHCSIISIDSTHMDANQLLNLYYSTIQMLQDMINRYVPCYISSLDMKYFCIVFCLKQDEVNGYKAKIEEILQTTFAMIHNYFNVSVYSSVGRIVTSPLAISESYQDARQIHSYLVEKSPILFFEDQFPRPEHVINNTFSMGLFKEDIKRAFAEYDTATLHRVFTSIIELFHNHPTKYLQGIDAACNILYLSLSLLSNGEEIVSEIFSDYSDGYRSIYNQTSLEQILHWLETLRDGLCATLNNQQKNHKNRIIVQVKKYIDEHIEEKLSLIDVASEFSITPNYLSLLFKKHSEVGFSEYITQKKIAYAKNLMESSNLKIYEIADRLGFESAFYFSKVFKKVEGCSPRDYRQY